MIIIKKICLILLPILFICFATGCSDDPESLALRHSREVSEKIHKLYKEKSQELSSNVERFFALRIDAADGSENTFITIEKDENGNWQYYCDDYIREPFDTEDKDLIEIIDALYIDYEVRSITIDDTSIRFVISLDELIYSKDKIDEGGLNMHIEGDWYHFKFPYGI
ncbi:MAG: hypothetical protein GX940_07725 [Clostridiaceae bacterium]|nr:hypothetical protein [Clostridiaceae bacterium]